MCTYGEINEDEDDEMESVYTKICRRCTTRMINNANCENLEHTRREYEK